MNYIDLEFYKTEYDGFRDGYEDQEIKKEITRASRYVDSFVNNSITDFSKLHSSIQGLVKKATANITEDLLLEGGYEELTAEGLGNVKIGSFGYTDKNTASESKEGKKEYAIPNTAKMTLYLTGLAYAGIDVK